MAKTKWYTPNEVSKIVAAARKFVEASLAGKDCVTVGKVAHEPKIGGRCSQFCREATEAGLGLAEHMLDGIMFGDPARQTAAILRAHGYSLGDTSDIRPGDLCYRPSGAPGHIFMYMGTDVPGHEGQMIFAENTSVAGRGVPPRPGTKYTRRGAVAEGGIGKWTEVFRLTKPGGA